MATRTRATATSNTPMKEKRGISPSSTGTTPRKIAQKNNSPAKSHEPAATNSSGKPVPNYLKATLSSGLDKTKAFSSVSTSDASNKLAMVNRRRSFEPQPPYNSQSQQIRSRVSPNPMSRSSSSSSSSSGKISSASSQKTASDKGLVRGTTKDGVVKQHSLYAKSSMGCNNNAKKSNTSVYAKKQVIATSNGPSMMKEEEVVVSPIEKAEDDHNVPDDVTEDEVVKHEVLQESKAEDGTEKADGLQSEEVGAIDHETEVIESDKDAKIIVTAESSSTATEQQHDRDDESVGLKREEEADQETNQDDSKEEIIIKEVNHYNNDSNDHENEIVAADNINDRTDDVNENDEEEESNRNESNETANASEASREEAKETETDDQVKEEVAAEKKPEKYQGKRESAVSNDVIEETASKLREQRKNKVKALAGAFETVISLQDSK